MRQPLPEDLTAVGRLADGTVYYAPLGQIPYDADEDRVQCHLCGGWYRIVGGTHLRKIHGWTVTEYRERLGLLAKDATASRGLSSRLRTVIKQRIDAGTITPVRPYAAAHTGRRTRYSDSLAALRPDLVEQLDRTRNPTDLDPRRVAVKSGRQLWWRCRECGHVWQSAPHTRARGAQCPKCAYRQRAATNSGVARGQSIAARRPELAAELHPTRNPGLDSQSLAPYSRQKVWWLCPTCGHEWQTTPSHRVHASGCPAYARRQLSHARSHVSLDRSIAVKRPALASELDLAKNPGIDPRSLAAQSNQIVWWTCPSCNNSWQATPQQRRSTGRCPQCRTRQPRASTHAAKIHAGNSHDPTTE